MIKKSHPSPMWLLLIILTWLDGYEDNILFYDHGYGYKKFVVRLLPNQDLNCIISHSVALLFSALRFISMVIAR
jgi:hypothetical protein